MKFFTFSAGNTNFLRFTKLVDGTTFLGILFLFCCFRDWCELSLELHYFAAAN
jgi:hypothetical protein